MLISISCLLLFIGNATADSINRESAIKHLKEKGVYIPKNNIFDSIDFSGDVQINDKDLVFLPSFPELEILHLSKTSITNIGLKNISLLAKLETLTLSNTKINDEGLGNIVNLTNISILNLKDTKISDEGLKYLKNMTKLTELNLMGTRVTDKGLDYLSELPNLQIIMVRGTKVTQRGFNKFKKRFPNKYITFESEEEMR